MPVHGFALLNYLYLDVWIFLHPSFFPPPSARSWRWMEAAGANPSQQHCSGPSLHGDVGLSSSSQEDVLVWNSYTLIVYMFFLKTKLLQTVPPSTHHSSGWRLQISLVLEAVLTLVLLWNVTAPSCYFRQLVLQQLGCSNAQHCN